MFVCAIATALPLLIGHLQGHLGIAIFGSLIGFLMVLNDHMGNLGHRLLVLTLTFLIMMAGLLLGTFAAENKMFLVPILLVLSYWLGLMGGQGAELERAVLFAVFMFLASAYTPAVGKFLSLGILYSLIGFACVIGGLFLAMILRRHVPNPYARLRKTFKDSLASERERHFYALAYCIAVLVTLFITEYFKIDHGYWAIGTVLLILRPDSTLSIYRAIQRFGGTLIGVLLAAPIIMTIHSFPIALALIALLAFISPAALARSYGLGSIFLVVMILLLLDLPTLEHGNLQYSVIRLESTGIGCGLALIGVLLIRARHIAKKIIPAKKFSPRK